jgi:hypothetical protein
MGSINPSLGDAVAGVGAILATRGANVVVKSYNFLERAKKLYVHVLHRGHITFEKVITLV